MNNSYVPLYRFWQVVLHMFAWGQPEYCELDAEARADFATLVQTGSLFSHFEDCKRAVIAAGIDAPDDWLGCLCAARVSAFAPLPVADRVALGKILTGVYPRLVRAQMDQPGTLPQGPCSKTYLIADLLRLTLLSNGTLNTYAKKAGVTTPTRGKRNHLYTSAEARKIFEAILASPAGDSLKLRCENAIGTL